MSNLKLKIGVVSMLALNLSSVVIGSAIVAISQSFPHTPISTIQLLSTLPGLGVLLSTLVAGQLAMKFSKKYLVLLGIALVTIAGMLPAVWHSSVVGLLACSVVLGVGLGFITTINPMLVSEYFKGEEQSSILGMGNGVTSLVGMVLIAAGGALGASHWYNLYWVFGIGILVFLVVLVCLPKDLPQEQTEENTGKTSTLSIIKAFNPSIIMIFVAVAIMGIAYTSYLSNLSIVVNSKGLGGTSLTGVVSSIGTIGGIIAGFGFKFIRKMSKPNTLAFGFICLLVALFLGEFATNSFILIIAGLLSNISMVTITSTAPFLAAMISEPYQIPMVMSIYSFINGLASALAPKIISMLGISAGGHSFIFAGVLCGIMAATLLISQFGKKAESGQLVAK